jgi:hypothetical protein
MNISVHDPRETRLPKKTERDNENNLQHPARCQSPCGDLGKLLEESMNLIIALEKHPNM